MQARDQAKALQNDLGAQISKLADLISAPPSRRDSERILDTWESICEQRPRANSMHRRFRSALRDLQKNPDKTSYYTLRHLVAERKQMGQRLGIWDDMDALVRRHVNPAKNPLIRYRRPQNDSDALLTLFHQAFFRLANTNAQSDDAKNHGCFADIAFPIQAFDLLVSAAYRILLTQGRADTARFLDVGCGGGAKVLAASHYFATCHGFDFDPAYVAAGQRALEAIGAENCAIFEGDGITFGAYEDYDVIYFYRPMQDDALLANLEQQVFETARPGTVVLAPYDVSLAPRSGLDASALEACVFVTGMSQSEADDLRYEAERMGPDIMRRPKDFAFDTGFWTPLLEAASFN